jgi:REP element-mobilizing transposase RayT
MPVYHLTAHAYRSWREDHPRGYVQRGEGLKEPSKPLADWRARRANFDEARFEREAQEWLHPIVVAMALEKEVRLHACATCPTHVHVLISFRSPACTCGVDVEHCFKTCPGRMRADDVMIRMKRKMGQRLAQGMETCRRPWFSRGWDTSPVKNLRHLNYLVTEYLPEHETGQEGIFRRYS